MKINILEISPHGPRYNQDFKYIATYKKGKSSKLNEHTLRMLFEGCSDGKEYILWFEIRDDFFNRSKPTYLNLNALGNIEHVSPNRIRNLDDRRFNYYKVGVNTSDVHDVLESWKNSDPMVIVGPYSHQFISVVKNYQWTYKFNWNKY